MSRFIDPTQRTIVFSLQKDDTSVNQMLEFGYQEVQRWDIEAPTLPWFRRTSFLGLGDSTSDPLCPDVVVTVPVMISPASNDYLCGNKWQQLYYIQGQCKDSGGSPLGPCVVDLFRTSDDLRVDTCTTDSVGNYRVYTPYNVAHYCVAYMSGSPDVAGATVNTLTGAAM